MLCAVLALLYVHQEVEIVKTSFRINKQFRKVSFLLDQYRSLVYNLSRLESPKGIEDRLSINEIVLCMPKTENIRRPAETKLVYSEEALSPGQKQSFLGRLFDSFSTRAEAEQL